MKASPSPGLGKDPSPALSPAVVALPRATLADVTAAALLALGAAFERRDRRASSAAITAVPIVLVNIVAFYGQYDYLTRSLAAPRIITTIMAAALESIAIYLAYQAHVALIADDSALRLRLGAYSVALLIAALNYSHWMKPGWRPTATAVAFALCSAISPVLWSIHSRRSSRAILKSQGLIEDHAVRLGATRWFWHVIKSVRVMYRATWVGENRPAEAIRLIGKPGVGSDRSERARTRKAVRIAAPETPPPVTGPREPRGAVPPTSRVKAQGTGLAAARNETEAVMVAELVNRELITSGAPLPAARALAGDDRLTGSLSTRRRAADRILADARARMDGNHARRVNGS
jgi:hypothetical protein